MRGSAKIGACLILALIVATAAIWISYKSISSDENVEGRAMQAFLKYCLPAISAGKSVEDAAHAAKLPQYDAKASKPFLADEPGKVFGLPEFGEDIALSVPELPACFIVLHKANPEKFIHMGDDWFSTQAGAFKLTKNNKKPGGEIEREYIKNNGANLTFVFFTVRPQPDPIEHVQAIIGALRTPSQH